MPFILSGLGFSNMISLLHVLLATIFVLTVPQKWRIAAVKKEETLCLLVLAAEESARAKL